MSYGTLTLNSSTVSENTTDGDGGGISSSGTLVVNDSTIRGNTGRGGGGMSVGGTAALTNSTVSGNHGLRGGGISSASTATELNLINCTVAGNTVDSLYSAISNGDAATLTNTVIDGDCFGRFVSGGNNVESPGDTCGFDQPSDQVSILAWELDLGPLKNNGGPTLTQLPGPQSVAIDIVAEEDCVVTTDQRGVARPQGPRCDAGAVEVEPTPQP